MDVLEERDLNKIEEKKHGKPHVVFPSAASKRIPGRIYHPGFQSYCIFEVRESQLNKAWFCQIASILGRFG